MRCSPMTYYTMPPSLLSPITRAHTNELPLLLYSTTVSRHPTLLLTHVAPLHTPPLAVPPCNILEHKAPEYHDSPPRRT